ncbi:hypothetical protein JR316_0007413 [Psilocybe cubensis]|uniref:Uncharacterized protein n=2 Tax=Psilocybe cubensis TaxID=181762 RepID=A0ACB8GZG1_PSICU|nr:hypothetical protein JR316_0007413 [Psilocybe cubensis]KAH9480812.1 hypothetical protein JR316_0007413 [Psilocybe cubensis]
MVALPALKKIRIVALPLTRPSGTMLSSGQLGRLTYYQFQISAKQKQASASEKGQVAVDGEAEVEKKGWLPEEGVTNWVSKKAADIWAGFGKAKGGWKLKTFQLGEKMVDRLEFEELALKSFDPSMGPSITQLKRSPVLDKKKPTIIPLIYPPSQLTPSAALSELSAYTGHRMPRHRRGFFFWMAVAPLTAPFMLIPIVPNLPFFFCVWRSWSHYRAYKSSQYLHSLLEHRLIVPEASDELDQVYQTHSIPPPPLQPSSTAFDTDVPRHALLLDRDAVPAILSLLSLKTESTAAADLYRAVEQARVRVSSGRAQL